MLGERTSIEHVVMPEERLEMLGEQVGSTRGKGYDVRSIFGLWTAGSILIEELQCLIFHQDLHDR